MYRRNKPSTLRRRLAAFTASRVSVSGKALFFPFLVSYQLPKLCGLGSQDVSRRAWDAPGRHAMRRRHRMAKRRNMWRFRNDVKHTLFSAYFVENAAVFSVWRPALAHDGRKRRFLSVSPFIFYRPRLGCPLSRLMEIFDFSGERRCKS